MSPKGGGCVSRQPPVEAKKEEKKKERRLQAVVPHGRAHSSQLAECDAGSEGMRCLLLYAGEAGWGSPFSVFSILSLLLSSQGFGRVYLPHHPGCGAGQCMREMASPWG